MLSRFLPLAGVSGYTAVALAAALVVLVKSSKPSKLDAIPTVGSTTWLGSWWAGLKYITNALDFIQEGYEKHQRAPFKIAAFHRWMVIFSSRKHLEELCRAPDDSLSLLEAINDDVQIEYTMGHEIHHNPYHIPVLRSHLTRNIGPSYPGMRDEIITALDDILDLKGNEWKGVPPFSSVQEVICRSSNRLFVGLPLCRDPGWIDLNLRFTRYVFNGSVVVKLFPTFLKPLAVRLFTKVTQSNERARRFLGPIIEERQRCLDECGNQWADKPNDLLSWLMEEAEGSELTVEALAARVLACNFAAIHTTSTSFTNALLYLAANPQYIKPLRSEVEAVVEKEGWTRAALGKMRRVDSFMRESERMDGPNGVTLLRKALKDFTFSDGTFIPKGTLIAAASRSIHHDEAFHSNAHAFDPFNESADLHEEEGKGVKQPYVLTTPEYLAFGHGKHACPGRFYSASMLKSMLAHIVVTYDVKLEDNAKGPQRQHLATALMFDPNTKVMFRRRVN